MCGIESITVSTLESDECLASIEKEASELSIQY